MSARIAEAGLLPIPAALDACAAVLRQHFAADYVELVLFEGPHRVALAAIASDTPAGAGFWTPVPLPGTAPQAIDSRPELLTFDGATSPDRVVREAVQRGFRCGLRLPLQDERGSAMGILAIASRRPAAYTERDLAGAQELAGLIANFVRRSDLLARVERRQQTAEVASAILAALSTSDDLSAACDTIARQLREFFAADHVAIGLLDFPARRRTVLGFSSDVLPGDLPAELPEEDVRAYTLAVEHRPERFDDLGPLALNPGTAMLRDAGIASIIRAPFQLADGRVGLVTVGDRARNRYRADDAEHLLEICRPVGLALDRVTLVAGLNTTTATLEAQARILAALTPDATLEATAHTYAREIRSLFAASHVVVTKFVPGGSRIVAIDSDQLTAEDLALTARPDRATLAQFEDVLRGQPQLIADLAAVQRGPADEVAFRGGLRTLLRQPLKRSDGTIGGLITVGSDRPEAYGPADLERLGEVSAAAAMVAERAELLDAARDRTAKVQSLTRLLGSLSPGADPRELSRTFAREARQLLHADMVVVLTFDAETGEGVPIAEEAPPAPVRDWFGFRWPSYRAVTALPRASRFPGSSPAESEWLQQVIGRRGLGSGIAVRLDVEGEAVGLVIAAAREPNTLNDGEQQLLSELATPLAMLIERARLLEAQRQQAERSAAILELLAAIGECETIEEVAEPVAVALSAMFAADACVIAVASNDGVQVVGHDGGIAGDIDARLDADTFRAARRSFRTGVRTIANLDRVRNPLTPVAIALRRLGMRSTAEALFAASGRLEVLVTLASRRPRHFTSGDGRQLAQIVRPLELAVAYQEGRRESAARARRLELTNQVLRRLTAGGRPREMARDLTLACLDLFGAAVAFVAWADPAADGLQVLAVSSNLPDLPEPPRSVPFGDGATRWFLRMQQPHIVDDAAADTYQSMVHRGLIPRGCRSVLRAPLLVRDEVQGAIVLWGEGTGRFSGEDLQLVSALVGPLAIALDNAVALEALAESEFKYRSLVAQADEMIFLVDAGTQRLIEVNAYTARTLGYEPAEMMTMSLTDIVDAPPETVAANIARTFEDGELHLTERRYRRRDGSVIEVDVIASVITFGGRDAILVLARDVSGRLPLQRQLLQSQKMESLGAMAGNVAHDFNNLLTAVLGFAGILKLSPRMSPEDLDTIALIEAAAQRAGDLSGRLLSFARGGLVSFGPVDLGRMVIETVELAGPTLHGRFRVESHLPDEPLFVEGDAGQLQQALFNILLNARDAMPSGGTIAIQLRREAAEVVLTVRDTGCGMDEETRLRIFEPFFTTKPAGTGTGLGMSITYGIVQAHHGSIAVESEPGAGTCFELRLPVLAGEQ
ncbi:MAG: GAF domain-containing protein [Hyphomicrobiales bacterium]